MISTSHQMSTKEVTVEFITKPIAEFGLKHCQFQHFAITIFPWIVVHGHIQSQLLAQTYFHPKFGIATASIATLVLTAICPYIYKEEANRHINTNKVLLITIFISPKVVFYCCKDKLYFLTGSWRISLY